MSDHIYLIDTDGDLHPMPETKFENEDVFQALLEKHPDLLVTGGEAPRWLLVTREMPVEDTHSGSNRWSLDHLFLDQHGIPTLVEVKRSTDTRLRREVVGQMLDYAANAVTHWSVDKIVSALEKRCEKDGTDPAVVVREHLQLSDSEDIDMAVDKFWMTVKTNLEAEKLRLLFVADIIPGELQRIIEFLNNQMAQTEVLGVELKLFRTDQFKTLVPRLVGQTEKAKQRKSSVSRGLARPWDEVAFLNAIDPNPDSDVRVTAKELIDWMDSYGKLDYREAKTRGTLRSFVICRGKEITPLCVCTDGKLYVSVWWLRDASGSETLIREFSERLNKIDGMNIPADWRPGEHWMTLPSLVEANRFELLKSAIQWLCTRFSEDT